MVGVAETTASKSAGGRTPGGRVTSDRASDRVAPVAAHDGGVRTAVAAVRLAPSHLSRQLSVRPLEPRILGHVLGPALLLPHGNLRSAYEQICQ